MRVIAITVAYCPAVLLARSLAIYKKSRALLPGRHIVVQGHYPINRKKNNNDIKLICEAMSGELYEIELWDPQKNLGSAQSQNWALSQLDLKDDDVFINLDPDSACKVPSWDWHMRRVLELDKDCALISCMAPMVERYLNLKNETLDFRYGDNDTIRWGVPKTPTPFNLSMWRWSFVKEIGGIPQAGLWWGETEAPFYMHCRSRGKYHAYLPSFMENEDGKFMQDKQQNEWKDLHMRTIQEKRFLGNFEEFLRYAHPSLLEIDTCKDLNNYNHP